MRQKRKPTLYRAVADLWLTVTSQLFDNYHPERHYMRGPGPKWHAKHMQANSFEMEEEPVLSK